MTEVSFHFNAPDKRGYACRVIRKGYQKGVRMLVLCEAADMEALDAALWTFASDDFIPHGMEGDAPSVLARSAVTIASEVPAENPLPSPSVLINLTNRLPDAYARFSRVIEVVTGSEQDRSLARERWRSYKADGIEPGRHDLNLTQNP